MTAIKQAASPVGGIEIQKDVSGEWAIVSVSGELDIATAPAMRTALEPETLPGGRRHVAVDVSGLKFCDSTGLNLLVRALKRLRAEHGSLILLHVPEFLALRLRCTGLDQIFAVPARSTAMATSSCHHLHL